MINNPMIVAIQNEINLSITVAAALTEAVIPAFAYKRIITPSTAPSPPGKSGIIPTSVAAINTSPIEISETLAPKAKNTRYTRNISIPHMTNDNGRA